MRSWITQNLDKKMDIKTLYKDKELTLQRLNITVGECQMVKYREITMCDGQVLTVTEVKEPPVWYLRYLKLKKIGL